MTDRQITPGSLLLAETLAARLCHDLSGLAGTLLNTLEMAEEEAGGEAQGEARGAAQGEALAVAGDAARALGGRLRLLRAAWGGPGGPRDAPALAELMAHASGQPRTRTDWSGCSAGPFAPAVARLLLNVALVGTESLRRGGVVRFAGGQAGPVTAVLEGQDAAWPATLTGSGVGPPSEPRQLQPVLAALFARADGIGLSVAPATPHLLVVQP